MKNRLYYGDNLEILRSRDLLGRTALSSRQHDTNPPKANRRRT